jgi:uncharacterized protein involved in response to NO
MIFLESTGILRVVYLLFGHLWFARASMRERKKENCVFLFVYALFSSQMIEANPGHSSSKKLVGSVVSCYPSLWFNINNVI